MRLAIEFPLVYRQMLQSAQQRRLWGIRLLLLLAQAIPWLMQYSDILRGNSALAALGSGERLLESSTVANLFVIYLLTPLTACTAISGERVRQTLPLLLISRLTPVRLLLEKFLWSLQLVFTATLVGLPTLAFAYSLGGLPPARIACSVLVVLTAAIQVNSTAIFWSSLTDKSLQAFWWTLLSLLIMFLLPPLLAENDIYPFAVELENGFPLGSLFTNFWLLAVDDLTWEWAALSLGAPVSVSAALIVASGVVLSKWPWEAPLSRLRGGLRSVLRNWRQHRKAHAGQAAVVAAEAAHSRRATRRSTWSFQLDESPIAWRECASTWACRPAYPLVISGLLSGWLLYLVSRWGWNDLPGMVKFLQVILLLLGVIQVQGLASRAIGHERERETLQVLLTVPMSTRNIIRQKLAAANRVRTLLMIPFATLSGWSLAGEHSFGRQARYSNAIFPMLAELLLLVLLWQHLTLSVRLSGLSSILTKSTIKAVGSTFAGLFAYYVLQGICVWMLDLVEGDWILPILPMVSLVIALTRDMPNDSPVAYLFLFAGPALMALVLLGIRWVTEELAPKMLNRCDDESTAGLGQPTSA